MQRISGQQHVSQALHSASIPALLTDIEGVGSLLVTQLQVEDVGGLRVMAEPQSHSEDDAPGQLQREQSHMLPMAGPKHQGRSMIMTCR